MWKELLAILTLGYVGACFAALEVNAATSK